MLTVLVNTISNLQVFLLKKKNAKATHVFSKNISVYALFNDQNFNDMLTNDIVSFEQVGPGGQMVLFKFWGKYDKDLRCPNIWGICTW